MTCEARQGRKNEQKHTYRIDLFVKSLFWVSGNCWFSSCFYFMSLSFFGPRGARTRSLKTARKLYETMTKIVWHIGLSVALLAIVGVMPHRQDGIRTFKPPVEFAARQVNK
jgi:hypothetical protein